MIETSQEIVFCYPVDSYVSGSCMMKEFTFVGPNSSNVVILWQDEGWDEGHIMTVKVIDLKKQPKNSRFYSLVLFIKSHEKPWKKAFIPRLCLPTFHHLRMRPKVHCFWPAIRRRIWFFYMLWQYKLDKNFNLTFEESRSLLSSMPWLPRYALTMKSLVNHFQSSKFSIEDSLKVETGLESHRPWSNVFVQWRL